MPGATRGFATAHSFRGAHRRSRSLAVAPGASQDGSCLQQSPDQEAMSKDAEGVCIDEAQENGPKCENQEVQARIPRRIGDALSESTLSPNERL